MIQETPEGSFLNTLFEVYKRRKGNGRKSGKEDVYWTTSMYILKKKRKEVNDVVERRKLWEVVKKWEINS